MQHFSDAELCGAFQAVFLRGGDAGAAGGALTQQLLRPGDYLQPHQPPPAAPAH